MPARPVGNPADGLKELMWFAFMNGAQKPNIPGLKSLVNELLQLATQKTGGQGKGKDIPIQRMDTITTEIAIEACCLVLSGLLDDLDGQTTATYKAMWEGLKKFIQILQEENSLPEKKEVVTVLQVILNQMKRMEKTDGIQTD